MKGTRTVKLIAVVLALILSVGILAGWTYMSVQGDIGINATCGDKAVKVDSATAKVVFTNTDETKENLESVDLTFGSNTAAGDYLELSDAAKEQIDNAIEEGYSATLKYSIRADGYVTVENSVDLSALVVENGDDISFKAIDVNMTIANYTLTFDKPEGIKSVRLNDEEAQLTDGKLNVTYFDEIKITLNDHYTCETTTIEKVTENTTVNIVPNFDWDVKVEGANSNDSHYKGWYTSAKISIPKLDYEKYTATASLGDQSISIEKDAPAEVKSSGNWTITVTSNSNSNEVWTTTKEIENVDSARPTIEPDALKLVFNKLNYYTAKINIKDIDEDNIWKVEITAKEFTGDMSYNETDGVYSYTSKLGGYKPSDISICVVDKAGNRSNDYSNNIKVTFDPNIYENNFSTETNGYVKEVKVYIETDSDTIPTVTLNDKNNIISLIKEEVAEKYSKYSFVAVKNGTYIINQNLNYNIEQIDNEGPEVETIEAPETAVNHLNVTASDAASGIKNVYLAEVTIGVEKVKEDPTYKTVDGVEILDYTTYFYKGIVNIGDSTIETKEVSSTDESTAKSSAEEEAKKLLTPENLKKFAVTGEQIEGTQQYKLDVENDGEYTLVVWAEDAVGNSSDVQVIENVIADNTEPVIENISIKKNNEDSDENIKDYYNTKSLKISATVTEVNVDHVTAYLMPKDETDTDNATKTTELTLVDAENKVYTGTLSEEYDDGDYYIKVVAVDQAGHDGYKTTKEFIIDTTDPKIDKLTFDPENHTGDVGYFNKERTLTIKIDELHYDSGTFVYKNVETDEEFKEPFTVAENGSTGNFDLDTKKFTHTFSEDGKYQPVSLTLTDKAGNSTTYNFKPDEKDEIPAFTVDQTPPKVKVSYDNNNAQNGNYFNADRTATITVTEHNFNDSKPIINPENKPQESGVYLFIKQTDKDGVATKITLGEWVNDKNDGDTYTLEISYKNNVNYTFDVVVIDKAGNKSGSINAQDADKNFDVDKVITAPTITGVNNGSAYNGDVAGTVNYRDANFQTATVRLIRADKNGVYDVTAQHTSALPTGIPGGDVSLVNFERIPQNDGIYTLTATITDKAGNTAESSITFSVNRFGSTYRFSDYLTSICDKHIKEVTEDLKITEINPNSITDGTVSITRNGKPIDAKDVNAVLQRSGSASGGWYEYLYTISKDYFKEDGLYQIIISSKDAAGNAPNSENDDQFEIIFWVDDTLPEISGIQGLEEDIINAEQQTVKLTIRDNLGLKSVSVYCDGKEIARFDEKDFTAGDLIDGEFTINESSAEQHIRIVAQDLSGNILDTDDKSADGAYITTISFERDVTVSTNLFVRWFANKPLFFTSLAVFAAVGVGIYLLIAKKKKGEKTTTA